MARIAPSERFRRELDELIASGPETDPIEEIARAGARVILQQALEDEAAGFLGRGRYERTGEPVSYRNGYEPRRVVTTSGQVQLERPRVRDASKLEFESALLGRGVARAHALEALVICSFLRGLSVRDVEAALEETLGERVIGKSTVARVCQDTRERYRREGVISELKLQHGLAGARCRMARLRSRRSDQIAPPITTLPWPISVCLN
jgi:putative transposase